MNTDKIVSTCAIIVSICALVVSVYQTKILSQEKDASVWPYLQSKYSFGPDYIRLSIDNDGIGPAIIQNVYYQYKDTTFHQIQNLAKFLIKKQDSNLLKDVRIAYSNIESKGSVIKAGDGNYIFRINKVPGIAELMNPEVGNIRIVIDYCSIYQKCWRNMDNTITPTKL